MLHHTVGSIQACHKVVLCTGILGGSESGLLGFLHVAGICSYGVARELAVTCHLCFDGSSLTGWHTQGGVAGKKHCAMAVEMIIVGKQLALHAFVEFAHKLHGVDFVAEPHLLEVVIATHILGQRMGKL